MCIYIYIEYVKFHVICNTICHIAKIYILVDDIDLCVANQPLNFRLLFVRETLLFPTCVFPLFLLRHLTTKMWVSTMLSF